MEDEFEKVIVANQGRLRYIASRYCQQNDMEDLYQEILLQLWRSFSSFKGNSSRETWLYKVALNTASTFVSKTIKNRELQQSLNRIISMDEQPGEEKCQAEILTTFMETLSDLDANILMMYLDGLSSEKMADVTGISSNAVRNRIKRIKSSFETQYVGEAS